MFQEQVYFKNLKSEIVDECSVVYVSDDVVNMFYTVLGSENIYAMEEALLAILGQRSAHSLATGPVMADLRRKC